ncbi:hypothetical protein [Actinoplanes siamensis]|uniref:Uncharacterized protein n=1 Tax=Actinoplanes siamensis TaxID=1223317 RepID=A0A919N372_9ACTN|nr:hypothetical protein [Actinoplanes siamensis]GIF03526.1 hypothetical protein Asi03nite_10640 [Actinoplanes siamensis]
MSQVELPSWWSGRVALLGDAAQVKDMVPGGRLAIAFRDYGMRTLKFHPRKERVIDKVLAPMHEAANAIAI